MTLLVRDEVDIVADMLDAHFALGVDHVIATDNRSEDGTVEVLERYRDEARLTLLHEPADDYAQARWVTRMARLAATELDADWVINADADEIWWPTTGDLHSALAAVPASCDVLVVPRFNFLLRPDDGEAWHRRLRWRLTTSVNQDGVTLGPKVCHRATPEAVVAMGNHAVDHDTGEACTDDLIQLLHFPMRSYRQFANKIAKGGAALARNTELPEGIGFVWRQQHQRLQDGLLAADWASWTVHDEALAQLLAAGEAVEDRRVTGLLDALPPREPPRPTSPRPGWRRLFRAR
jgi:hypothetical protein